MDDLDFLTPYSLAQEVIESALNQLSEIIYNKEIKFRARGFGVSYNLDLILCVLEFGFVRRETGTDIEDEEMPELSPPITDTWMRSSIPVHKKFISPKIEKTERLETIPEAKSTVSFKTSFYRSNTLQKLIRKPSKIFEEPLPEPMEIDFIEISDAEEFMRLKKERDYKRKQEEIIRLEALKKEEENKRKLLAKQFNGKMKNFTYDCNGKILIINPPKIEADLIEKVEFKVKEDEKFEDKIKSLPRTGQNTRSQFERKKMLDPIIEKPMTKVYSLSILEHIRLAPGVSIGNSKRVANTARSGELVSGQIKKIENHSQGLQSLRMPEPGSEIVKKKLKLAESASEAALALPQIHNRKEASIGSKVKSKSKSDRKKSYQIKQYSKEMTADDNLTDYDKFNLAILNDLTWGKNPATRSIKVSARVPKAMTAKDQWEIYGYLAKKPKDDPFISAEELWKLSSQKKKPRDRPFIEKVHTKTKPPAPPLGQTMFINQNES